MMRSLDEWLSELEANSAPKLPAAECFSHAQQIVQRLNLGKIANFVIVVTGTNGKGSVVACLEKIAMVTSKSVGAITSPHLVKFNERIKINAQSVTDEEIVNAYQKIDAVKGTLTLNYVQYAYIAGLIILHSKKLDLAILEVGLGGRYDVMNTVENDMTIIANIDYDHCDLLGSTRDAIGAEKSALIRFGTPVIIGDRDCPLSVIEHAEAQHANLFVLGKDFDYQDQGIAWTWQNSQQRWQDLPKPSILLCNAAIALQAFFTYDAQSLSYERINKILLELTLAGRCQLINEQTFWLLDVAHNPQAVEHLATYANSLDLPKKKIFALFGICHDKDKLGCLSKIVNLIDEWHICPLPVSRSATIEQIQDNLTALDVGQVFHYQDIYQAYVALKARSTPNDLIIVFGSFVIVGMILKYLQQGV